MLENEHLILASMESPSLNVYFVPLVWAAGLVNRARKEGRVKDDFAVKTLIDVSCILFRHHLPFQVYFPIIFLLYFQSTHRAHLPYHQRFTNILYLFVGDKRIPWQLWNTVLLRLGHYTPRLHSGVLSLLTPSFDSKNHL